MGDCSGDDGNGDDNGYDGDDSDDHSGSLSFVSEDISGTEEPGSGGAGELLELPISSDLPLEGRGVSEEWVSALFVWMTTHCLFRIPTRVFVEAFVQLITAPHRCALYDFIPVAPVAG